MLLACSSDVKFQEEVILPDLWTYQDTIQFSWQVSDTTSTNEITLDVTYNKDTFSYENLYVYIKTFYPNSEPKTQIVSLNIQDKDAFENRICSDEICNVPILLLNNFRFNALGNHKISLVQHSRQDSLLGIKNLKLSIVKLKS
jgi:gliding motility-associated lipoprotein GldH